MTVWIVGSAAAWLFGSTLLTILTIHDPRQILPESAAIAEMGLLLSIPLGIFGWLTLRRFLANSWGWLGSTVLGLPVGLGAGFLVNAWVLYRHIHATGVALIVEGGGEEMYPAPPITLAIAGFVVAAAQAPFLTSRLVPTWRTRILWLFGSAMAFGGGWFAAGWLATVGGFLGPAQHALAGAISGTILLLLLLFLDARHRPLDFR
jgi:hypothetical protein